MKRGTLLAAIGLGALLLLWLGRTDVSKAAAQSNAALWIEVTEDALEGTAERSSDPLAYRTVRADESALQAALGAAPLEFTAAATNSVVTLTLPLPDGSSGRFRLFESPVMAPELAAKYPQIKTYTVKGVDDPYATGRVGWTYAGFHGLILTPEGDFTIEPYSQGDTAHYLVYYTRDADPRSQQWGELPPEGDPAAINALVEERRASGTSLSIGENLHTYRLAVATTGEYAAWYGGTVSGTLSRVVNVINNLNAVMERDVAVRLELIANNDQIIYTNPNTDPYTDNDSYAMLDENEANLANVIGEANFDIGHVFSTNTLGLGNLGSVCTDKKAHGVSIGNLTHAGHEVGHQFGATHTFNGDEGSCEDNRTAATAYEPGAGSTLLSYGGGCGSQTYVEGFDTYYHTASQEQITAFVESGDGATCGTVTTTGNNPPVVTVGAGGFTIPIETPFVLSGSASDSDGDPLTFRWEELDLGPAGHPNNPSGDAPIFRSFPAATTGTRYFPQLSDILSDTQTMGEILPTYARSLTFRLTAQDNQVSPGAGGVGSADVSFDVSDTAGPFQITYPNEIVSWNSGDTEFVSWDVANTTAAPVSCSSVNIRLSANGGQTFPTVLVSSTPNDGIQSFVVPNINTSAARLKVECSDNIFFAVNGSNFVINQTFFVGINGAGCQYQTINDAITAASSGDTINITPGLYAESLAINSKDLTLQPAYNNCTLPGSSRVTIRASSGRTVTALGSTLFFKSIRFRYGNSAGDGGGLYLQNSNVTLDDSLVVNNSAGGDGGGVYLDGGSLTLRNGTEISFNETTSGRGGGIFATNGAGVSLTGSDDLVSYNQAIGDGGGIYLDGSTISLGSGGGVLENLATGSGGGIYASGILSMNLSGDSLIEGNSAAVHGGGLYLDNVALTLSGDSTFHLNDTGQDGGAIYVAGPVNVSMTMEAQIGDDPPLGSIGVYSNAANRGGGIFLADPGASMTMADASTVERNQTYSTHGGGVYLNGGTLTMAGDSKIEGNLAQQNGGGLFATNGGTVIFHDNSIVGYSITSRSNAALGDGGGVYLDGSGTSLTMNSSSRVSGNNAVNGGGIFATNGASLTLNDTAEISGNNNTSSNGGGLYASGVGTFQLNNNSQISDNEAQGNGGGVYLAGTDLTLRASSYISSNQALSGGGVYVRGSAGTLTLEDNSYIATNSATAYGGGVFATVGADIALHHWARIGHIPSPFYSNTAEDGGGLYLEDSGTTLTMDGSSMVALNQATNQGGGIYIAGGADAYLSGSASVGHSTGSVSNDADTGGGIYLAGSGSTLNLSGSALIQNNQANTGGGLAIENGAAATLDDATVSGNQASGGGGIYGAGTSTLTMTGGLLTGNNSGNQGGGGLKMESGTSLTLDGTIISYNDAYYGGGLALNSWATLSSTQIISNSADDGGGGIYASSANTTRLLFNTVISDNVADRGGGIFLQPFTAVTLTDSSLINNETTGTGGGGAYLERSGSLSMNGGSVQGNRATNTGVDGHGAGFYVDEANLNLTNVQVSANQADGNGGAIWAANGASISTSGSCDSSLLPANSYCMEFRENDSGFQGGGLMLSQDTTADIAHTALISNTGLAGGLAIRATSGSVITLTNAMVRDHYVATGAYEAVRVSSGTTITVRSSTFAGNYSGLISNGTATALGNVFWDNVNIGVQLSGSSVTASCNNAQDGMLPGTGNISQNPLFVTTARGDYHLDPASPSVDACSSGPSLGLDGVIRPQNANWDMGAFESYGPLTLIVDSSGLFGDTLPGDSRCESQFGGGCTLRAAVEEANARPITDTILVTPGSYPAINLTVSENVVIRGASPDESIISGSNSARPLRIFSPARSINVLIRDLTISGGLVNPGRGGAILNQESLTLLIVRLTNNEAVDGGAVANTEGAVLTLINSTIDGNTASGGLGGGLYNEGIFEVTNSTFSGNLAATSGGGLYNYARLYSSSLTNVTIASNEAQGAGGTGGIVNSRSGAFFLNNSIVGDNLGSIPDCQGSFEATIDKNLVETISAGCTFTTLPQYTGDPLLRSLGDYGGPTPTQATTALSDAVDNGGERFCPPQDQRGYGRNGPCDLGAYEFDGNPTAITLSQITTRGTNGQILSLLLLALLLAGLSSLLLWSRNSKTVPVRGEN